MLTIFRAVFRSATKCAIFVPLAASLLRKAGFLALSSARVGSNLVLYEKKNPPGVRMRCEEVQQKMPACKHVIYCFYEPHKCEII